MNVSLVSGWVPAVVESLAVVTLVLSVGWRSGAWRRIKRELPRIVWGQG